MQTIVLHFLISCLDTPLLDCLWHIFHRSFLKLRLHTNKRRPCSSTLSGHPSSSLHFGQHLLQRNLALRSQLCQSVDSSHAPRGVQQPQLLRSKQVTCLRPLHGCETNWREVLRHGARLLDVVGWLVGWLMAQFVSNTQLIYSQILTDTLYLLTWYIWISKWAWYFLILQYANRFKFGFSWSIFQIADSTHPASASAVLSSLWPGPGGRKCGDIEHPGSENVGKSPTPGSSVSHSNCHLGHSISSGYD